jgi:N-hydroxyarylamine O-acetyltransferase
VIDALLARIGLDRAPAADAEGLRVLHRAYLSRMPYEGLAVQLGETGPLDEAALAERVLRDGRGGYCFELNTLLAALLRAIGFVVTHHQAVVGGEGPTNHMALLVHLDGERWLADAGLGEGFIEPLPFREGRYSIGPLSYSLEGEPGGSWWIGQHEWGSFSGFRMVEEQSPVSAFEVHHRRLATDPASSFMQTLVVQQPREDRIVTLRARTLSSAGPSIDDKRVVVDPDEFAAVLHDVFGITLRGARLERVWTQAAAQHDAFLARV